MKKTLSTFLFLTFAFSLSAQKLQKPQIDKISGDTTWQTTTEKLFAKPSFTGTVGEQLYVSAAKVKKTYLLSFSIQTGKTSLFTVDEGQKIYLKLKNDTIVTLTNINSSISEYSSISYGSNSYCYYPMLSEDIEKLSMSDVQFIRLENTHGTFDYDIKDKFSNILKKLILLIKEK